MSADRRVGGPPARLRAVVLWLGWLLRVDPWRVGVLLLVGGLPGLVPAVTVWVSERAFALAARVVQEPRLLAPLLGWLALLAALQFGQRALHLGAEGLAAAVHHDLEERTERRLQEKVRRLRVEVLERPEFGDLLRRARGAALAQDGVRFLRQLLRVPELGVSLAALGVLVGRWNPWLLALVALVGLASPLAEVPSAAARRALGHRQAADERLRDYVAHLLSTLGPAKEVRAFGLQDWLLARWREAYQRLARARVALAGRQAWSQAGLRALAEVAVAGAVGVAAWQAVEGRLAFSRFAALQVALLAVRGTVLRLQPVLRQVAEGLGKAADLFAFLDLGPEESAGSEPLPTAAGWPEEVAVESVWFQYPGRSEPALRDVTLTVRRGERLALVGENGSGKTTLAKVLLGVYRPARGRVRYGDRDLWSLDLAALRARQVAVFQDYLHYALTLAENVGVGEVARVDDRAAVEEAARRGGADEVAAALPAGYDTLLTRVFPEGTSLSGGQWQRVAVSRALMRQAPAVVVFDEPTASLDPRAEAEAFRRFASLTGDAVAVLVTHRLGAARACDRVAVLQEGRLVQCGTHEELLAVPGPYAELWDLQARWYQEV